MSYTCQNCQKHQPPQTTQFKHVVETRIKRYRGDSIGTEIVKEINVCPKCKESLNVE